MLEVESRESDRDMATDTIAGVMLEMGDDMNILFVAGARGVRGCW